MSKKLIISGFDTEEQLTTFMYWLSDEISISLPVWLEEHTENTTDCTHVNPIDVVEEEAYFKIKFHYKND